jgi:threonine dehydrogenase-like Zn-dependent dehydrogenase
MHATLIHAAGDIRFEEVPDPIIEHPTDALVKVVAACVCGSDLWPYRGVTQTMQPHPIGHEFVGIVEEVGSEVRSLRPGQFVIAPFACSDGTCVNCRNGQGADAGLECVGSTESMQQALDVTRPGGRVGYVGVPNGGVELDLRKMFGSNIAVSGGVAPVRAYVEELLVDVLSGVLDPGRVFDLYLPMASVADAYAAMDQRRSIKALLTP